MREKNLIFLKLGGSLITDKNLVSVARIEVIEQIAKEISQAIKEQPNLQLIIGHGSGSFGHQAAKKFNTRMGVSSNEDWLGFTEVWKQANALNKIVISIFIAEGLPVKNFPPSNSVIANNGKIAHWNLKLIQNAIEDKIIPIVQGDTVIDNEIGGTIISTEEVFAYLATEFIPNRILLAGIEPGIWKDFPVSSEVIKKVNNNNFQEISKNLKASESIDVTGGMQSKVKEMLALVNSVGNCEAEIFSGKKKNSIYRVLSGERIGTIIIN